MRHLGLRAWGVGWCWCVCVCVQGVRGAPQTQLCPPGQLCSSASVPLLTRDPNGKLLCLFRPWSEEPRFLHRLFSEGLSTGGCGDPCPWVPGSNQRNSVPTGYGGGVMCARAPPGTHSTPSGCPLPKCLPRGPAPLPPTEEPSLIALC